MPLGLPGSTVGNEVIDDAIGESHKGKCALVGKFIQEYSAEDRFEGTYGQLTLIWIVGLA
jgi:hypothetical protein